MKTTVQKSNDSGMYARINIYEPYRNEIRSTDVFI